MPAPIYWHTGWRENGDCPGTGNITPDFSRSAVRFIRICLAENPGPADDLPEPQKMLALAKDGFETE